MVILLILNTLKGALSDELDQFFQAVFRWSIPRRFVTASAFSQARRKLSHAAFLDLLDLVCDTANQAPQIQTYQGFRVFAIDGSTMRLPDNRVVREAFGVTRNKYAQRAMGRISLLHDVLNRITYDAILGHFNSGEIDMVWDHLEAVALPEPHLILLDRGYYDFATLRQITENGGQFCIRLRSNLGIYKAFLKEGRDDVCLTLKPPKQNHKDFPPESVFRQSFRVRVVRYRIEKKEYILMTSLLDPKHSVADLGDLYHARWQVEESFKLKKCRLHMEHISGATPEVIRQDFHARVLKETLTAVMALDCSERIEQSNRKKKLNYQINLTQALAKMKNTLPLLLRRKNPGGLIKRMLEMLSQTLTSIEPGRKYPRRLPANRNTKTVCYTFAYRPNR